MRKLIQTTVLLFFLFCSICSIGQEKKSNDPDFQLKETIYAKNKKEVLAYDKKDFDALFFDFFQKQNDDKVTLTKEEFYNYTIKIAIYSEKLGLLYKDQKEESQRTKEEWFNKSYSDYLKSKR
ncbi:hypothetical protein OX283_005040 [Flavobacterium sp. SUN052]|uniref:hypothetical protein n=1 Tax=Flavobacterium sp. SUN052 TaxID=3002441 RepID=UPI00237E4DBE|nr:hypothetical protein [Flavobacterium sp. SUN052]MEC4004011.1 hypothetical protein [Flavobacterium sp. SUN052]